MTVAYHQFLYLTLIKLIFEPEKIPEPEKIGTKPVPIIWFGYGFNIKKFRNFGSNLVFTEKPEPDRILIFLLFLSN